MEIVCTERLVLRDLEEGDWRAVHNYASDPEVVHYVDWGPNTVEDTRNFIQRAISGQKEQPRRNYTLAIVLGTKKNLIGSCGIDVSNPDDRSYNSQDYKLVGGEKGKKGD